MFPLNNTSLFYLFCSTDSGTNYQSKALFIIVHNYICTMLSFNVSSWICSFSSSPRTKPWVAPDGHGPRQYLHMMPYRCTLSFTPPLVTHTTANIPKWTPKNKRKTYAIDEAKHPTSQVWNDQFLNGLFAKLCEVTMFTHLWSDFFIIQHVGNKKTNKYQTETWQ